MLVLVPTVNYKEDAVGADTGSAQLLSLVQATFIPTLVNRFCQLLERIVHGGFFGSVVSVSQRQAPTQRQRIPSGCFFGQVVTYVRNYAMLTSAEELRGCRFAVCCRNDPVRVPVQRDCRNLDNRHCSKLQFDTLIRRVSRRQAKAMTVGVDRRIDVIRILEGTRVPVEGRLVKAPGRRVAEPQGPRELAPVGRQACASAIGLEIVLVPEP